MSKSAIPLALATVAVVAACAYPATPAPTPVAVAATPAPVVVPAAPAPVVVYPQTTPAVVAAPVPQTVVVPQSIRPGIGRIESITAVPPSSSADTAYRTMRRLGIKMNDGTMQYVDSEAPNVAIGDRVELTSNGYILHPI